MSGITNDVLVFEGFLEEREGSLLPFALTIGPPKRGEADCSCLVHAPTWRRQPFEIFGIDAAQATELAIQFVRLTLDGRRLIDLAGKPVPLLNDPPAPQPPTHIFGLTLPMRYEAEMTVLGDSPGPLVIEIRSVGLEPRLDAAYVCVIRCAWLLDENIWVTGIDEENALRLAMIFVRRCLEAAGATLDRPLPLGV